MTEELNSQGIRGKFGLALDLSAALEAETASVSFVSTSTQDLLVFIIAIYFQK